MKDLTDDDLPKKRPGNRWKTSPLTVYHESPKTSLLFVAQSRAFSNKQLTCNQPSTSTVQTPKSCQKNPFEDISSLEYDKCSPGLFVIGQSSAEKGEFRWSIEEISRVMPAQIDSPIPSTEECSVEVENAAQEAIERYFSFRHAVASPPDAYMVESRPSSDMSTPPAELFMARAIMGCRTSNSIIGSGMISAISSTPCARSAAERRLVIKVDECTQTNLSLPPTLPPELEIALRPYMSNKYDNIEVEECNISNTALRRKLFFNKEDELSPVKGENSIEETCNSPAICSNSRPSRIDWTPDEKCDRPQFCHLSSPDVSPIKFKSDLEFTRDMTMDDYSSLSSHNKIEDINTDPIKLLPNNKLTSVETEIHHAKGIFNSTVQYSQNDRTDKDTGYSTIEVDNISSQQGLLNIK